MDKSEDLSRNIQNIKSLEEIEDYITDHNYTHTFKWPIPTGI